MNKEKSGIRKNEGTKMHSTFERRNSLRSPFFLEETMNKEKSGIRKNEGTKMHSTFERRNSLRSPKLPLIFLRDWKRE